MGVRQLLGLCTAIVVLVALGPPGRVAGAAEGEQRGLGIRLLEVPADRVEDPRARSYVIDHVAPATTLQRRFEVRNGSPDDVVVDLYAVGAMIEGSAFVPAGTGDQDDLSSWISVEPGRVPLPPNGSVEASLRIDVPPDARPGERYALVLAQQAPTEEVGAGELAVTSRVGLRVYLSVGTGGEPPTDFTVTELRAATRDDGSRAVQAQVSNTGGRALDVVGQLSLQDGPGGLSAGPFPVSPGVSLAPGEDAPVEVVLDAGVPRGPWLAEMRLTSGTLVREVGATIEFPAEGGTTGSTQPAAPLDRRRDALLRIALVLLVLVGIGLGGVTVRGRRAPGPPPSAA